MTTPSSSALLLRYAPAPADAAPLLALSRDLLARHAGRIERIDANRALDGTYLYWYVWLAAPLGADDALADTIVADAAQALPGDPPDVLRLAAVQDLAGASRGTAASHHYVVETDIAPGVAEDLAAWYGQEHLPGLAAVEGNIRSRRLETRPASGLPRSLACYDLTTPDIQQHPDWRAVRDTDWASRIRPHFANTRRVMCARLYTLDARQGTA